MTDIICVDYAAQEDLMLWDQLARAVKERASGANRLLVLVGSAEAEERKLDVLGHPIARVSGALLHVDESFEISMRNSTRKAAARLTDEGVYAVGLLGIDRGLVRLTEGRVAISKMFENQVWMAPGVGPVLGCLARGEEEDSSADLHPVIVAASVADSLADGARIIMLTRRRTPSVSPSEQTEKVVSPAKLKEESVFHAGFPWPSENTPWRAVYAGDAATFSGVEVR